MVWFLKKKIRKKIKKIMRLEKELEKNIREYNELVNIYNFENFFTPIGSVNPETPLKPPETSEPKNEVKKIITKKEEDPKHKVVMPL